MKIYVASSWRNKRQPEVVQALRLAGHEVYDFKNPAPNNNGFHWSEISPDWKLWTPNQFLAGLKHPIALAGFDNDMSALKAADAVVLVLPSGRSAHLEAGYAVGAGKPVFILLDDQLDESELMYMMVTEICTSMGQLVMALREIECCVRGNYAG